MAWCDAPLRPVAHQLKRERERERDHLFIVPQKYYRARENYGEVSSAAIVFSLKNYTPS
jgi:hypothetical protein